MKAGPYRTPAPLPETDKPGPAEHLKRSRTCRADRILERRGRHVCLNCGWIELPARKALPRPKPPKTPAPGRGRVVRQ